MKEKLGAILVVLLLSLEESEACTISLCEKYCSYGYYNTNLMTPWGEPCICLCCPPVVCRMCIMRKKIIARDKKGCVVCKCGWSMK